MHALVADMLRLGADVHACDALGWTPLHAASRGGSAALVAPLVAAGADVGARGGMGSTALDVAMGDEVRVALLAAGAALPGSHGSSRTTSRGSTSHNESKAESRLDSRRPSSETAPPPPTHATPLPLHSTPHPPPATAARRRTALPDEFARVSIADATGGGGGDANANGGAGGATPRGGRPSSSRHAQRLRAMVQAPQLS
jgi:hypothetical protein